MNPTATVLHYGHVTNRTTPSFGLGDGGYAYTFRRFMLLAFVALGLVAEVQAYDFKHIILEEYVDNVRRSQSDKGSSTRKVSSVPDLDSGKYGWIRTEIWKESGWPPVQTLVETHLDFPYEVKPNSAAVVYEKRYFELKSYAIKTASTPSAGGSVSGAGTYPYGTSVTLTASSNEEYAFVQWQDGNKSNPRKETVTGDATYTATFQLRTYNVSLEPGTYGSGAKQTLTKTHGTTLTLPGEIFSRGGYKQGGWSYDTKGATKDYVLQGSYTKNEATTLYPYWSAGEYTITINPGYDGGVVQTKKYSVSSANQTVSFSAPSRGGYDFSSWQTDFSQVTGTVPTAYPTSILIPAGTYGDIALTARWTGKSYTITVSANGGSGGSTVSYTTSTADQIVSFTNPTRGGYDIGSWSVGSGCTGAQPMVSGNQVTIPANTYGNFTLTPTWNGKTYSVTIAPGEGGTGGDATQYTVTDSLWQWTFTAPTRTGYHIGSWDYDGWNKFQPSVSGSTLTIPANAYGNITAMPMWTPEKCSLSISSAGNGSVSSFPSGSPQDYGSEIEIEAVPDTGYAFGYWKSTVEPKVFYENPHTFTITADVQFKAYFTNKVYMVVFNAMGGTCAESSRSVKYGSKVGALPKPTYGSRPFLGWFNDQSAGSEVTQDIVIDDNKTFYARWGETQLYTIATNVEPSAAGSVAGGGQCASGEEVILTANPNSGYSFEKWKDGDTENPRTITVTGDATYTACFTGNVYRVQFDPMEGGISGVGKFYVQFGNTYGAVRLLPKPMPPDDQQFDGWYTEDEGGTLIADDTIVSIAENHTLYARYKDIVHIHHYVRFDGNEATSGEMEVQEFVDDQSQQLTANAYEKDDYTFVGWATNYTDATLGVFTYTNCQSVSFLDAKANETNVLYATWKINQYPLTLYLGTGIDKIYYSVTNGPYVATSASTRILIDCGANWRAYATPEDGYSYTATSKENPTNGTMTIAGVVFAPEATPNTIKVTYNWNRGTGGTMPLESTFKYNQPGSLTSNGYERVYNVRYDDKGEILFPSNSIWLFTGWNNESNGTGMYSYVDGALVTNVCDSTGEEVTLYAQWTTNAASIITLPEYAKDRYKFLGWGESEQNGEEDPPFKARDPYVATSNTVLHAYWKAIPTGTLSLKPGQGVAKICYRIGSEGEWTEIASETTVKLNKGDVWSAYAVAKVGYATNATCVASGTMEMAGVSFSPVATANTIPVNYEGNGATDGEMGSTSFTYDQAGTLPANGFVRTYSVTFNAGGGSVTNASGSVLDPAVTNSVYAFAGWATNFVDAVEGVVTYENGQSVMNLSTGNPVTLYAVWTTNAASVVTLPGAQREDYELLGWSQVGDKEGSDLPVGSSLVPTNDTGFVAKWKLFLGELSEAVGLTNAVLKATPDTDQNVNWVKRDTEATKKLDWDYGYETYVRLVNTNSSSQATLDASSPLKLFVKQLEGPGTFTYEIYWGSGPQIRILDICEGVTNVLKTISSQTKWASHTNNLSSGQHEIVWLASGTLKTSDKIAVDNMSWTPGVEFKFGKETIYDTEEQAKDAAAIAIVTRPNADVEDVISAEDYKAMFGPVRAVPLTTVLGKWTLTADLTPIVSNKVQEAVDRAASNLVDVVRSRVDGESELSVNVEMKAGLYYGIAVTNEVVGFSQNNPTNLVRKWVLGTGLGPQTLSVGLPSEEAGFFKVLATPVPHQ